VQVSHNRLHTYMRILLFPEPGGHSVLCGCGLRLLVHWDHRYFNPIWRMGVFHHYSLLSAEVRDLIIDLAYIEGV